MKLEWQYCWERSSSYSVVDVKYFCCQVVLCCMWLVCDGAERGRESSEAVNERTKRNVDEDVNNI